MIVRLKCLLGGVETVMEEVSPYDGGSGITGGNESTYPYMATILKEHNFGET